MNPNSAFDQLVQRQFEVAQPSLAHREWERMDRQLREFERIDRMTRDMDRVATIVRETELQRERAEIAMSRHAETLRACEETMRKVYSQPFVDSLVRTQQFLLQHTLRAAEQQAFLSQMNDVFLRQAEFAQKIESVAQRIIGETALQAGLVSRLVSSYRPFSSDILTTNYDELLNTVLRGFEETGLTQSEVSCQTILWRFDAWLDKFPPNVKNIVISIIVGLLLLVVQEALDYYKSRSKALPAAHENQISSAETERAEVSFDMCR
jgi:hypothetical protein